MAEIGDRACGSLCETRTLARVGRSALRSDGDGRAQILTRRRQGSRSQLTIHNVLEGHGLGKLLEPLALRSTRKGADDFGKAIKTAVEVS